MLISEGVTSLREAVRAGLGVAVLPDWLIREDLLSGQLVRVLPHWNAEDLPVHVVYAGARLLPTRVRAFIDFAISAMTKDLEDRSATPSEQLCAPERIGLDIGESDERRCP